MSPLSAIGCDADDDVVAVEDAGVDHRLAADPQHEQVAVAGEVRRGRGSTSSTFSAARTPVPAATSPRSGTWRTGRRSTDRARARLERDLDRARLARVAAQVALVLQRGEVRVHRRRRRQADGLADLADARRVAPLADLGVDELEHLALAGGERGAPAGSVGGLGAGGLGVGHGGDGNTITRSGQTPVRFFS